MKPKLLYLLIGLLPLLAACERERELALPEASISILNYDGNPLVEEPASEIEIDFVTQSLAGIKQVEVFVNGTKVKTITMEGEVFTFEHNYVHQIPGDISIGQELQISFRMEDHKGRAVSSQPITVKIAQAFRLEEVVHEGQNFTKIWGKVNKDLSLTKDRKWLIDGIVKIDKNTTLTIEAGTSVYFMSYDDNDKYSALAVLRDGKIQAVGKREAPIVFTSDKSLSGKAKRGDWGGILILGKAPSNAGNNVLADNGLKYGGNNPDDNSGKLRFIRIEYSGKAKQHALQLYGVGSTSEMEYIESFESNNNAFRLKGGRVSLRYIAGIQHGGYGIWADEGWQGKGQFWLFQTNIEATLLPVNYWNQARSVEFRNDDTMYNKEPITTFMLSNLTLIGNGYESNQNKGTRRGLRVRRGARGLLYNAIVTEFPNDGVRVEDLPEETLGSSMIIDNIHSYNNAINWGQEAEKFFFKSGKYNLKEEAVAGISTTNFVGSVNSSYDPKTMDTWFVSASYIGAVNPSDDWTTGGSWFKNADGSLRK